MDQPTKKYHDELAERAEKAANVCWRNSNTMTAPLLEELARTVRNLGDVVYRHGWLIQHGDGVIAADAERLLALTDAAHELRRALSVATDALEACIRPDTMNRVDHSIRANTTAQTALTTIYAILAEIPGADQ